MKDCFTPCFQVSDIHECRLWQSRVKATLTRAGRARDFEGGNAGEECNGFLLLELFMASEECSVHTEPLSIAVTQQVCLRAVNWTIVPVVSRRREIGRPSSVL